MKKIVVLFLSVVLLFATLPTVIVSAAKEPTFVVSSEKATAGDTVKITVSTKNNPGIISMKLLIKYDSTALKLVEAEKGKFDSIVFGSKDANPFIANWIEPLKPNNKTNGVITTLTFEVLNTAPQGKSEISLSYNPDDVFEITKTNEFLNVNFATQSGYIDIINSNADKNQSTSSQNSSNVTVSNDESQQNHTHNESDIHDTHNESDVHDTTGSQILEQFLNSSNQQQADKETVENNSSSSKTDDNPDAQNDWLIWVVVAAVILLGGAFAIVIIKSKKEK